MFSSDTIMTDPNSGHQPNKRFDSIEQSKQAKLTNNYLDDYLDGSNLESILNLKNTLLSNKCSNRLDTNSHSTPTKLSANNKTAKRGSNRTTSSRRNNENYIQRSTKHLNSSTGTTSSNLSDCSCDKYNSRTIEPISRPNESANCLIDLETSLADHPNSISRWNDELTSQRTASISPLRINDLTYDQISHTANRFTKQSNSDTGTNRYIKNNSSLNYHSDLFDVYSVSSDISRLYKSAKRRSFRGMQNKSASPTGSDGRNYLETNAIDIHDQSSDRTLNQQISNDAYQSDELSEQESKSQTVVLDAKKYQLSSSKVDSKRDLEFSTSIGQLTNENNFVHIQNDTTFQLNDEEVSVSVVLDYCKKRIFKPYFRLVSIVGLRPLFGPNTLFNLSQLPLIGCLLSSINIIYTLFVLLVILLGYLLQATSCYRQDGLPTFVESASLCKGKHDTPVDRTTAIPTSTRPSVRNLSIDFNKFNQTINHYDKLNSDLKADSNEQSKELKHLAKSDRPASPLEKQPNKTENDYFKKNYLAYKDVYEIELKNGHIWLNRPLWIDGEDGEVKVNDYINPESKSSNSSLVCSGNLFTMFLLPDLLHLSAYLFTIYLMRASEIEKTEHLLEKSFLQASQTNGWIIAHRKLVQKLRFFLYLAFAWLIISIINHLLHILFQTIRFTILDQLILYYHQPHLQGKLQNPLLAFTVITLIVKDLVCSVIIASYAIHCELNISFIQNLCRSLREKKIELQEFVKGIEEARKFVHYLNHEQSLAVSLLTVSISSQLLQAFYKLFNQLFNDESTLITALLVSVSAVLWLSKLLTPLIQASRLSSTCNELRYIGLELRARPFGYQDTLQSDLDSIVIYTCNLRLKGKIIYCPIKKSFLFGLLAVSIMVILFLGQINYF